MTSRQFHLLGCGCALAAFTALTPTARAAIGCTLSNPAQDLKSVYPQLTSYRQEVHDLSLLADGARRFQALRDRVGSDLDPVYETYETPYTIYTVYQGDTLIGIVHGVNVPGVGGVIQVFLSVAPDSGSIRGVFFQRIESNAAKALRSKAFRDQFVGLSLADYYRHDYYAVAAPRQANDKLAGLKLPDTDAKSRPDVTAAIRGIRKNLILLDLFLFNERHEPYYQRAQEALKQWQAGAAKTDAAEPKKEEARP